MPNSELADAALLHIADVSVTLESGAPAAPMGARPCGVFSLTRECKAGMRDLGGPAWNPGLLLEEDLRLDVPNMMARRPWSTMGTASSCLPMEGTRFWMFFRAFKMEA